MHAKQPAVAYAWAVAAVAICTGLAWPIFSLVAEANLIMVYLLGVMLVAVRFGRGPALAASTLSVLTFDLLFVPPYFSFAVSDTRYLATFGVMLLAAFVISDLAARQREARVVAQQREAHTRLLSEVSRAYVGAVSVEAVRAAVAQHLGALFAGQVGVLLPDPAGKLVPDPERSAASDPAALGVAQWVYDHTAPAGPGTATLPGAGGVYLPLIGARGRVGVLGLRLADPPAAPSAAQLQLLDACANQTALAIERALLADVVQRAEVEAASERARSALLSSVSHGLRTPLAVVMGALSSILERGAAIDPRTRAQLTAMAYAEATQLSHQIDHLLVMTRLEAGGASLRMEWQSLEELIGAALALLDARLIGRPVAIVVPPELPLVALDGQLITQVVTHLVENALTYTPPDTPICIRARLLPDRLTLPITEAEPTPTGTGPAVQVEVADAGPGLPPGAERRVFEKFYRGPGAPQRGVGLGLAICRGIISAHGGAIWAERGSAGGTVFRFWLPIHGAPPQAQPEGAAAPRDGQPWRKVG